MSEISKNNALVQKMWEKKGFHEHIYNGTILSFLLALGIIDETLEFKGADKYGDEVTVPFVKRFKGPGKTNDDVLAGNEKTLELDHFKMKIGLTRQGAIVSGINSLDQIRTNVNFEKEATEALPQWHAIALQKSIFNHLCGNTANVLKMDEIAFSGNNIEQLRGHNPISAPTEGRIYRPGGKTTDEALGTGDKLTIDHLEEAVLQAAYLGQPLEPSVKGGGFIVIVSPKQARDLKADAKMHGIATSQIEANKENFLEDSYPYPSTSPRKVFSLLGFDIYQDIYVSEGVDSQTGDSIGSVHRGVILGKKALCFGAKHPIRAIKGVKDTHNLPLVMTSPQLIDHEMKVSFAYTMIYGLKKYVFNGQDYGTIVLPSYVG